VLHENYNLVVHKEVGLLFINAINVKIVGRGQGLLNQKRLPKTL